MKASTCLASLLSLSIFPALAFQPSSSSTGGGIGIGRRDYINGLVGAAVGVFSGIGVLPQDAEAVISKQICASGQGDGCDDLAEGNEYIKSLQQKSAANAEMYARVRASHDWLMIIWGAIRCMIYFSLALLISHSFRLFVVDQNESNQN